MSKTVTPDGLSKAINDYLEKYSEDIEEDVENLSNELGKEARDELRQESQGLFKGTGKYAKGWTVSKDRKKKTYYAVKVWNRTDYQLTHLLEFGHATRNGGRTRAFPHIRPVEEKFKIKFEKDLINKIRRDSK